LYEQKKKQYPSQYVASDFSKQYGKRVHDCVGLIKGYLWTNDGKLTYNAEQDKDVSGMRANCYELGNIEDMPDIPGLLVFMQGHVGIYIGNGRVIEARGHMYGVVETFLSHRGWQKYGKLKWIEYIEENKEMNGEEALEYLIEKGRITSEEYWRNALKIVRNQDYVFIKWANDLKELEKVKSLK
jgi:hypothetical protein